METLAQLGEDALIRRLTDTLPPGAEVLTGPGDDCAVVRPLRRYTGDNGDPGGLVRSFRGA